MFSMREFITTQTSGQFIKAAVQLKLSQISSLNKVHLQVLKIKSLRDEFEARFYHLEINGVVFF